MEVTAFPQTQRLSLLVKETNAEGFFQSLHDAKIMMNDEWRVASGEWLVASGKWRVASGE
jgi:hypothetical protein